jgi:hypothetical protein
MIRLAGRVLRQALRGAAACSAVLSRHRASALMIAAAVSFVAGFLGFTAHDELGRRDWTDRVYLTFQLFVLNWSPEAPVPLLLQLARFAAPVVSVLGAAALVGALVSGRLNLLRARLLRDHTVVCGAGDKGSALASAIARDGRDVLLLDPAVPPRWTTGDARVVHLRGDATVARDLRRARVGRAREVVALCGRDGVNIEVAYAAATVAAAPRIHVHLTDERLAELVHASPRLAGRVELFNVLDTASRGLLARFGVGSRFVVAGDDELCERLVVQGARYWRTVRPDEALKLPVMLVGPDARGRVRALRDDVEDLAAHLELDAVEVADASQSMPREVAPREDGERSVVISAFVDEGAAVAAALDLRRRFTGPGCAVSARVTSTEAGLGEILRGAETERGLGAFTVTELGMDPESLIDWRRELVARVLHTDWIRRRARAGDPSAAAWNELGADEKHQDRARAQLLLQRLEAWGYTVEDSLAWSVPTLVLTGEQIEQLARDEHERWLASRRAEGWVRGDAKDPARKLHPELVDWDELPDAGQEYNRAVAREFPEVLAALGVRVARRQRAS